MFIKLGNKLPVIKVVGIGGFGKRTIQEMILSKRFDDIDFITISPDKDGPPLNEAITNIVLSNTPDKSSILENSYTKWEEIALESKEIIKEHLTNVDILFISCNEGKGFSTGVAPVVAKIASECGALVIAVVTIPFKIEGKRRRTVAEKGIELLKQSAGTTIIVNKQRIFENIVKGTLLTKAYGQVKAPLYQSIEIISKIIRVAELINIDLADLKLIMGSGTLGFIGEGIGTGDVNVRSQQALEQAFSFPLTDNSINEAKNILFNITGSRDLAMSEIEDIAKIIAKSTHKNANVKFGVTIDEEMAGKVKVTIIATSMNGERSLKDSDCLSKLMNLDIPMESCRTS